MKKASILLTLMLLCVVLFLSGCCCSEPKGFCKDSRPGLNSYSSDARICRTVRQNGQMAWNDFDDFWMINSPSRLSWLRTSRY